MTEKTNLGAATEPWKARERLPAVKKIDMLLACAAVLISSLGLCFVDNEKVSYFFLIPLLFFAVWGLRSPGGVTMVLFAALISSVLFGSLSGAAAFLALVVGVGSLSWIFTVTARPYAAAIPLGAAIGGYLLTSSLPMAALAVSFLPAAALLAVATVTHQRRTTAICFCIGGFLLSLLIGLGAFLYQTLGTLELSEITAFLERFRASLARELVTVRDALIAAMRDAASADAASGKQMEETLTKLEATLTPAVLEEIVALFFSILPALAVMAASVTAFFAQLYLNVTYYRTGWKEVLTLQASVFSMSVVSSVIYAVGFLLTMFVNAGTVFGAAVQNITLMLLPGFCVMGWGAILASLRLSRGGQRIFLIILLVISCCCAGFSIFYFLALWGAYAAIMTSLQMKMAQKISEMGTTGQRPDTHEENEDGKTENDPTEDEKNDEDDQDGDGNRNG